MNHLTEIVYKPTKNLSDHRDIFCELVSSLVMRVIHLGEMSKLGWLIGFVAHATWTD
jgi:hypothetical protein